MNQIKLSLEELIFSFYSEGLFESGIQLKESFFPEIGDQELQFMLEIASRSLIAKDMIREEEERYKLNKEVAEFIHVLNRADCSVQVSCFSTDLTEEEVMSVHIKNEVAYIHEVQYDQQVHTIRRLTDEEAVELISKKVSEKEISDERKVVAELSHEDLEGLLEEFSDVEHLSAAISRWTSQLTVADIQATSSFLMDLNTRKSRINTMMVLAYNQHNNPEPEDICFFIPGKQNDWVLARNEDNRFNLELTSKAFLKTFIPSSIFKINTTINSGG